MEKVFVFLIFGGLGNGTRGEVRAVQGGEGFGYVRGFGEERGVGGEEGGVLEGVRRLRRMWGVSVKGSESSWRRWRMRWEREWSSLKGGQLS